MILPTDEMLTAGQAAIYKAAEGAVTFSFARELASEAYTAMHGIAPNASAIGVSLEIDTSGAMAALDAVKAKIAEVRAAMLTVPVFPLGVE